jgi:nicotinate-nucleotide adenylyltransferase
MTAGSGFRRVGILGGSFDPFHCGHADLGRAAEAALDLTELVIVPSSLPPHRASPVASSFHRFAMAALATSDHERWRLDDAELVRKEPSFTMTTLAWFREAGYRPTELFFVVGADAFAGIATWRDYPALLHAAHFAVVSRPGHPVSALPRLLPHLTGRMIRQTAVAPADTESHVFLIDAPTADVSSTAIRAKRAGRQSIDGLVHPRVAQYIERHDLYASSSANPTQSVRAPERSAGRLHGQD